MKKFSIIIPFYYNEKNIPVTLKEIYNFAQKIEKEYTLEFIFIDDGSEDDTWNMLNLNINKNYNHKLLKLSKNFGSHNAIAAGFEASSGDVVGLITSDMQDPIDLFKDMLDAWKEGFEIILAVRNIREDNFFQRMFSNIYYRLLKRFSNANMPLGGYDFFVVDKKVAKLISDMNEKNSSITCQISWAGFNRKMIYYKRKKREIGRSKWSFNKKVKLFTDSFIAFSVFPIRMIQIFAVIFSSTGFIYIIVILILKLNNQIPIHGIATVIGILCISSGLILFSLSIIGEYIWRILDQSRKRPNFIIEKYSEIRK